MRQLSNNTVWKRVKIVNTRILAKLIVILTGERSFRENFLKRHPNFFQTIFKILPHFFVYNYKFSIKQLDNIFPVLTVKMI